MPERPDPATLPNWGCGCSYLDRVKAEAKTLRAAILSFLSFHPHELTCAERTLQLGPGLVNAQQRYQAEAWMALREVVR